MRRVVVHVGDAKGVKETVAYASQDDAKEDESDAGPVHYTVAVGITHLFQGGWMAVSSTHARRQQRRATSWFSQLNKFRFSP